MKKATWLSFLFSFLEGVGGGGGLSNQDMQDRNAVLTMKNKFSSRA